MKLSWKLIIITSVFFVNYVAAGPLLAAEVGFGAYQGSLPVNPLSNQAPLAQQTVNLPVGNFAQAQVFNFFDNQLAVNLPANFVSGDSDLTVKQFADGPELPWNLDKLSQIYDISLSPALGFDEQTAMTISLAYTADNNYFKQVYYFDQDSGGWKAVPTTDFPKEHLVKAVIHQTAVQVAIFAKPGVLTVGKASWYKYKNGLFAASPDFPKGSRLRVTNLDNDKSVEVIINDWGPDRARHPDRVVDLDKVAFSAIADTADGVANVMVSPIELATDRDGRVLGVKAESLASKPVLSSKSVVVINEATGQIILDKNSQTDLPLASLTKIMAMQVFLNTEPDMNKKVAYKLQDEKYNYLYCKVGESAKVKLKDGEKLTIKDLFYSALVGSANNAVESLVRVSGLSRPEFIKQMNEQAQAWGATHTKFVEPTGLSSANKTTAFDYALILGAASNNPLIAQASATPSYTFKTAAGKNHTIKNTNKLIIEAAQSNLQAEKFPISASKTGYLAEAGYCLATRIKLGDDYYIIVTLGSPTREKSFNEMADLIRYMDRVI